MSKEIYTTPYHKKAEEKIGTEKTLYYCTIYEEVFKTMEDVEKHCSECHLACDRRDILFHKKHNLRGLNMKPLSNFDPLIKMRVSFLPLEDNERITRQIWLDDNP